MKCSTLSQIDDALEEGLPFTIDTIVVLIPGKDLLWFKSHEEATDQRVREEGIRLLFDAMIKCNSLKTVLLDGFFGTSEEDTDISKLEMQSTMFEHGGAYFIVPLIEGNTSIVNLSLSENPFGDEGARIISEALRKNKTLLQLDINNCYINEAGCSFIVDSLIENKDLNLQIFSLDSELTLLPEYFQNNFEEKIVEFSEFQKHRSLNIANSVAKLIENKNSLLVLSSWGNNLKLDGIKIISIAFQKNKTLRAFHANESVGVEELKSFSEIFSRNTSLIKLNIQLDRPYPDHDNFMEIYQQKTNLNTLLLRNNAIFSLSSRIHLISFLLAANLLPELVSLVLTTLFSITEATLDFQLINLYVGTRSYHDDPHFEDLRDVKFLQTGDRKYLREFS